MKHDKIRFITLYPVLSVPIDLGIVICFVGAVVHVIEIVLGKRKDIKR